MPDKRSGLPVLCPHGLFGALLVEFPVQVIVLFLLCPVAFERGQNADGIELLRRWLLRELSKGGEYIADVPRTSGSRGQAASQFKPPIAIVPTELVAKIKAAGLYMLIAGIANAAQEVARSVRRLMMASP